MGFQNVHFKVFTGANLMLDRDEFLQKAITTTILLKKHNLQINVN